MTKKSYKYIFLGVIFLGFFMLAMPVSAALVPCGNGDNPCTWNDLFTLANNVINFLIFTLGIPLVTVVIVVSGVQLVWSHNEAAYKKAKDRLQMALLGLLIMLSAWLIVKAVVVGLTTGDDVYNLQEKLETTP